MTRSECEARRSDLEATLNPAQIGRGYRHWPFAVDLAMAKDVKVRLTPRGALSRGYAYRQDRAILSAQRLQRFPGTARLPLVSHAQLEELGQIRFRHAAHTSVAVPPG